MSEAPSRTPSITIWGAGTTRTFRPIWVAEKLGLDYTHKPIGLRTGETQTTEYTRLNPKQKIPYFKDAHVRLSESVAISRYLIERYGSASTLSAPASIEVRAKEDEWVSYVYGELDETSLYVMRRHGDLKAMFGEAPQAMSSTRAYATKHLQVISDYLEDKAFVLGERLGLADVILVSCLDWAAHCGFDLARSLEGYRDAIREREAYKKAFRANYAGVL